MIRSFGTGSLRALLGYKSTGTLKVKRDRGELPDYDIVDWQGKGRRWTAECIADWLIANPRMLGKVTDPDMLALVSDRQTTVTQEAD